MPTKVIGIGKRIGNIFEGAINRQKTHTEQKCSLRLGCGQRAAHFSEERHHGHNAQRLPSLTYVAGSSDLNVVHRMRKT
jgi:hypothetical protein